MANVDARKDAHDALVRWAQRNGVDVSRCKLVDRNVPKDGCDNRHVLKLVEDDRIHRTEVYFATI